MLKKMHIYWLSLKPTVHIFMFRFETIYKCTIEVEHLPFGISSGISQLF